MQSDGWQAELRQAVSNTEELLTMLDLSPQQLHLSEKGQQDFPLRVPRGYISRMRKGDPEDPLLRQVLPIVNEDDSVPGFSHDPVGDLSTQTVPGVLHKYHGRALLVTTGACAVHCRYCFRRHFPYAASNAATGHWQLALAYIQKDQSIKEVILSGGDPLSLSDARLEYLAAKIAQIPHVIRMRIHTRLPIVVPERVDKTLLDWLCGTRLQPIVVLHANHANEIDESVSRATAHFRERGVTLLNQSVLLRGVNDSVQALVDLSESLFSNGVLPYYLHLLDPVQGAAHFDVDRQRALYLVDGVRARLPGYLVPRLVREQPGAPHKIPAELLAHD